MPRSKAQIRRDLAARTRCEQLIKDFLLNYKGQLNAGSVAEAFLSRPRMSDLIERDQPLTRMLCCDGLKIHIRDALKSWDTTTSEDDDAPQLSLFPAHEQPIVRKIARARIWLPSRQSYVPIHDLSPEELEAAAAYYAKHGQGEIRLAFHLRELASIRQSGEPRQAA